MCYFVLNKDIGNEPSWNHGANNRENAATNSKKNDDTKSSVMAKFLMNN